MAKIARTLGRPESRKGQRDHGAQIVEGPRARGAQDGLELGEAEFDRIEVGTIGWQKSQGRAGTFNRPTHVIAAMGGEVIRMTRSPGRSVGTRTCSTYARKLS